MNKKWKDFLSQGGNKPNKPYYELGMSSLWEGRKELVGRSLPETGYDKRYVIIYRAKPLDDKPGFIDGDFITLSKKFAVGHAEHNVVVNEEPQVVVKEMVRAENVYEAPNPGEYLYFGPDVKGKIIYKTKNEIQEAEPYQQHQKYVHPVRKTRLLTKGGNKTKVYPNSNLSMKRSKSAPPGAGGS